MQATTIAIAGTDTDAGKTVVTAALAAYWLRHGGGRSLGILKPVQSGIGDREYYERVFGSATGQTTESLNPLWFEAPLAPPIAAEREGKSIDLAVVWRSLLGLQGDRDLVLVEGVGGLGSPVTHELTVADMLHDWRLPTVLVVPVRLGAIAQAVANAALARSAGVSLLGIVLNCTEPRSLEAVCELAPADLIANLTGLPVLGCLPFGEATDRLDWLAAAAADLEVAAMLPLSMRRDQPLAV